MKARKAKKSNKFVSLKAIRQEISDAGKIEAEKLSKYNKSTIKLTDLNPMLPHGNIYGLLFLNDSRIRALKAIKDCANFGLDYTVEYPQHTVKYKIVHKPSIETTRTQSFLTPLEVCFMESINTLELIEILNSKTEEIKEEPLLLF
jgi:hypothetical protein